MRITKKLNSLRKKNKKALVTYIMAGDPSIEKTDEIVSALEEGGADIIELGIPFSDPLADGPTIQKASERALASGTTVSTVLNLVSKIRQRSEIPIVIMTYYNIIYKYGEKKFVYDAVSNGVDGVILPDLPPEEASDFITFARAGKLDTIFLIAPTSTDKRISIISKKSTGFIYYVSLTGVTGARESVHNSVRTMVEKIKKQTTKPIIVGFGISKPEQASKITDWSDGVVVGSAIVKIIEKNDEYNNRCDAIKEFTKAMKKSLA